ncbi:MAG: hypothetical protein ACR2OF_03860 [Hyphomicrobium sp.]
MARKRYTTEQIISLLREAEVRLSRGEQPRVFAAKNETLDPCHAA